MFPVAHPNFRSPTPFPFQLSKGTRPGNENG
jgi:hypothetical protein